MNCSREPLGVPNSMGSSCHVSDKLSNSGIDANDLADLHKNCAHQFGVDIKTHDIRKVLCSTYIRPASGDIFSFVGVRCIIKDVRLAEVDWHGVNLCLKVALHLSV